MDTHLTTVLSFMVTAIGVIAGIYYGYRNFEESKQISPPPQEPGQHSIDIAGALIEKYKKESTDKDVLIKSLSSAVGALTAKQNTPHAPEGIDEALACLERNDTQKAESIFAEILKTKEAVGQTALKDAAQAAKHIGALMFLHDTERALEAYKKATRLAPNDTDAWNSLGVLKMFKSDLPIAQHCFEKVLALGNATSDRANIALANGNLGLIAQARGKLDKAKAYHNESLTIYQILGSQEGIANQYGNLGIIAQDEGDLNKAEENYNKTLAIEKKLGRRDSISNAYCNLGIIAQRRGELIKAGGFLKKSLSINQELGRRVDIAKIYGNLGSLARTQGNLDKAEDYYNQSLAINQDLGRLEGMAYQYGNLGHIAKAHGNIEEACRLWHQARDLFEEIGIPHMVKKHQGWLDDAEGRTEPTPA